MIFLSNALVDILRGGEQHFIYRSTNNVQGIVIVFP